MRDCAWARRRLANDGTVNGHTALSREHVLDMTTAARQPDAFRPGHRQYKGSSYAGYDSQTWLLSGSHRRFALLGVYGGVYGQAIFCAP